MSVSNDYQEDNWVRIVRHHNQAELVARFIREQLRELYPQIFSRGIQTRALSEQGWSNLAILASNENGQNYVVKLIARSKQESSHSSNHYEKESWLTQINPIKTLIPAILPKGTGVLQLPNKLEHFAGEYAFMIQSYLPYGTAAELISTTERQDFLSRLASSSRLIHQTEVAGFGSTFSEQDRAFQHRSWSEYINQKTTRLNLAGIRESLNLKHAPFDWLNDQISILADQPASSHLYHRDLFGNWGNVLIDSNKQIKAIIDWEYAGTGLPFEHELASYLYVLIRDGVGSMQRGRDLAAVLSGYQISRQQYRQQFQATVIRLILLDCLSALSKYQNCLRQSTIEQQPWRKLFAERANLFISRNYQERQRHGSSGLSSNLERLIA